MSPVVPVLSPKRVAAVREAVADLYGERPTLDNFPSIVFPLIRRLTGADASGYGELDPRTGATRGTIDPMLPNWGKMHLGYYQHMHSHPFWQIDPVFFSDGPKRAEDVFGAGALTALPMYGDALATVGVTDLLFMAFVFAGVRIGFGSYRLGGKPFNASDRDSLAAFQPHIEQAYELAWHRTVKALPLPERIVRDHRR